MDRVLLGRERRVRTARPRFTGEKRAAEDTPRAEADLLSDAPVVARQQEDRVSGRASQHLVRGHRRAQAREGRQGSVSVPTPAARPCLVARQQVDCLFQAAPELHERDLSALDRGGQEPAADRRPERCALSGLRQRRQASLLHGEHRFRAVSRGRHPQRGSSPHAQHLSSSCCRRTIHRRSRQRATRRRW